MKKNHEARNRVLGKYREGCKNHRRDGEIEKLEIERKETKTVCRGLRRRDVKIPATPMRPKITCTHDHTHRRSHTHAHTITHTHISLAFSSESDKALK